MPEGAVRERVLVVEDQTGIRDVLARILGRSGYRCTLAQDVRDADAWLRRAPFDLIISDIRLPDGSGPDLVADALPRHEPMAALMMTTLDDVPLAEEALRRGAYGYIVKPFSANDVLIAVLGALRARRVEIDARGQVRTAQEETIQRLCVALEARDPEAAPRISRMSGYCWHVARELDLASEECELIRLASPMHDVGNVGVSDRVLLKPGPLSDAERMEMERHAEIGYRILAGSPARLLSMASTIAWTHHERFDGGGYPRGLAGLDIPLYGRIAAVADCFVALTAERAYRPRRTDEEALRLLEEGRATAFDPVVLDAFLSVARRLASEHSGPEVGVRASLSPGPGEPTSGAGALSPRERQVLQLAADGRTAPEIAEALVLSPGTVKTHFQRIYAKLEARDRAAAVAVGLRRGLIE